MPFHLFVEGIMTTATRNCSIQCSTSLNTSADTVFIILWNKSPIHLRHNGMTTVMLILLCKVYNTSTFTNWYHFTFLFILRPFISLYINHPKHIQNMKGTTNSTSCEMYSWCTLQIMWLQVSASVLIRSSLMWDLI